MNLLRLLIFSQGQL
jgi:hypothetical protein